MQHLQKKESEKGGERISRVQKKESRDRESQRGVEKGLKIRGEVMSPFFVIRVGFIHGSGRTGPRAWVRS